MHLIMAFKSLKLVSSVFEDSDLNLHVENSLHGHRVSFMPLHTLTIDH